MTAKKSKRVGGGRKPVVSVFGHHMLNVQANGVIKPKFSRLVRTATGYRISGRGGHR